MQGCAPGGAQEQVAPKVEVDVLGPLVHEPRRRPPHLHATRSPLSSCRVTCKQVHGAATM